MTTAAAALLASLPSFENEEFLDFTDAANRRAMEEALTTVGGSLGREYDMVVGGRRLKTDGKITSVNPARPPQVIGVHQRAEAEHAEAAVEAARAAFAS